ncbi:MAG: LysR family transcriptional regulator [Oceanospirillaceae bacterium]|nr:LysR family transcriptional regulator [Oceanospirillaceae bacterium]
MDRFVAIKSFIEVASRQSFTQTAEQLDLTRLQVSRHVQEVEAWLQQRLLHRTTRKVSLTPQGVEALAHCQRILNEVSALEFSVSGQDEYLTGTIRIAAPIGFANNLLLTAVEKFTKVHPKLCIDILAADDLNELVEDRVDIALRFTDTPDSSLIVRPLMTMDSVLCAAPVYLEEQGVPTHPQDLKTHNCFVHLKQNEWSFVDAEQEFKVAVSGNIKANSLDLLIKSAVHGNGIVRAPCDFANSLIAQGKLTAILTPYTKWRYRMWAVYLSRSYQSINVRSFIDFLVEEFKEDILLERS